MLFALAPVALLLAADQPDAAEAECLDLSSDIAVEGSLEERTIQLAIGSADGTTTDEELTAYVLTLPERQCFIDAGGNRLETAQVHAYSDLGDIEQLMKRGLGKTVRLTGDAFPGHTRYHVAPVVMEVYGFATLDPADMDDPLAH